MRDDRKLAVPGILLGAGLGGFLDGIVLHQVLQWHHMVSSRPGYPAATVPGLEANTFWDGLFHLATWVLVAAGLAALWRVRRDGRTLPGRALVGWMLAGWGGFNVADSAVNHYLLGLHHVRSGANQAAYDIGFLALGVLLLVAGLLLVRYARPRHIDLRDPVRSGAAVRRG